MTFSAGDRIRLTEEWPDHYPHRRGSEGRIELIKADGSLLITLDDGYSFVWAKDARVTIEQAHKSLGPYIEIIKKAPPSVRMPALDGWLKRSKI